LSDFFDSADLAINKIFKN